MHTAEWLQEDQGTPALTALVNARCELKLVFAPATCFGQHQDLLGPFCLAAIAMAELRNSDTAVQ